MATQKQIDANRRNALKSTGPRTQSGKQTKPASTPNATASPAKSPPSPNEEGPIFEKFKSQFIADLAPKATMELSLATSIAWDTWRLNRLRAVEVNLYAIGTDTPDLAIHWRQPPDPHSHDQRHDLPPAKRTNSPS